MNTVANKLSKALSLAQRGFYVFPLTRNSKTPPHIKEYYKLASRSPLQIKKWWLKWPNANIGISTTIYKEDECLIVIDIDVKNGKDGETELHKLLDSGLPLPQTYQQMTPSGGRHLVYKAKEAVKNDVDVLGLGLDIRSYHGYIVGSGSEIDGLAYEGTDTEVEDAPKWVIDGCKKLSKTPLATLSIVPPLNINQEFATKRFLEYLRDPENLAVEGSHGEPKTMAVARKGWDFGVMADKCFELMAEHWNQECSPPWDEDQLREKVIRAHNSATSPFGNLAPEFGFHKIEDETVKKDQKTMPIYVEEINKTHAFILIGGDHYILWETLNADGYPSNTLMREASFHKFYANEPKIPVKDGDKPTKMVAPSTLWLTDPNRRTYTGFCFLPQRPTPEGYYNLWRGFSVEPYLKDEKIPSKVQKGFETFIRHLKNNICNGNEEHFHWLISFTAHLFQRPWEKPGVAVVLLGEKGTGKNVFMRMLKSIMIRHYFLTADREDLVGRFSDHLEHCLLLVLDEAMWAGCKEAEGKLKHLITGEKHRIEHKNKCKYEVSNFTRIFMLSNEKWVVPASAEERRFAVFQVGGGNIRDTIFFGEILDAINEGANKLFLEYLLNYDISQFNPNLAPKTEALTDQKIETLPPFGKWWFDCLDEEEIMGASSFIEGWPKEISKREFRDSFGRHCVKKGWKNWQDSERNLGISFKKICPGAKSQKVKKGENDKAQPNGYILPPIEECKAAFEKIYGKVTWSSDLPG